MLDIATSNGIAKALIVAQEILINNELQKKSDELKASMLASENLHLEDLLAFAIEKASNTEQQLEISNEQIVTLKEDLRDASQELESYQQELDACHHEMATLVRRIYKN